MSSRSALDPGQLSSGRAHAHGHAQAPQQPAEPSVIDLMTREVAVVRDNDSLAFASQVLMWRNVRHLPVLDLHDRLVGMLSDRDLLPHVLEGPMGRHPVAEFMSRTPVTVHPDTTLTQAAILLCEQRVDALFVLQEQRLVGVLTTSDVLSERSRMLRKAHPHTTPRAADVMRQHVLTARPSDTLESAIGKVLDAALRHLPVVDDDFRVVGIISDRDIRTAVGDPRKPLSRDARPESALGERLVASFMTPNPTTVLADVSVTDVAEIFVDERIGAVPVVRDDDTLLGIISYVDVIAHFVGRRRR